MARRKKKSLKVSKSMAGGAGQPPKHVRHHIVFTDMRENDAAARGGILGQYEELVAPGRKRALTEQEQTDLALGKFVKDHRHIIVDPLFVAVRDIFGSHGGGASGRQADSLGVKVTDHKEGGYEVTTEELDDVLKVAAVYGLLEADKVMPPPVQPGIGGEVRPDEMDPRFRAFSSAFFSAFGEMDVRFKLLKAVFAVLLDAGKNTGSKSPAVSAVELARVLRDLDLRNIGADEPQLKRRVNESLDMVQNVGSDQPPSRLGIELPNLDDQTDTAIQEDNILALQPIYFGAMFEELKVFQVRDKLAELFQNGVLPIGRGHAGDVLYSYWKDAAKRMTEAERRSFYARTLGIPGGDDGGMPNREFSDLWLRFISSVSTYVRQYRVDAVISAAVPVSISDQIVRKAGRDLAANLSLHGYGMAYWVATELQKEITGLIDLLSDTDIKSAYGARDMWQVIDQVATLELGGAKNSVKYRTMATSGAIIMAWLAKHAKALSGSAYSDVLIPINDIFNPMPLGPNKKATTEPRAIDLYNACDQWLAVTGTEDTQVEQYSQPREAPMMTSRPVSVPSIARDMLESAGVPAMGLGRSDGNGRRY